MNNYEQPKDYYKILQLSPGATTEEIRLAYRRLAKKSHPDSNDPQSSVQSFQEIQEAYEVLKEPHTRDQYLRLWKIHKYEKECQDHKRNLKIIRIECQIIYYRYLPQKTNSKDLFQGFDETYNDLDRAWNMKDADLTQPDPVKIHDTIIERPGLEQLISELYQKRLSHRDVDGWEFQGDLLMQSLKELGSDVEECLLRVKQLLHDLPQHPDNFRTGYALYSMEEEFEIWNRDALSEYARLIFILEKIYRREIKIETDIQRKNGRIDTVLHIRRLWQQGFRSASISRMLHDEVKPREIDAILKVLKNR